MRRPHPPAQRPPSHIKRTAITSAVATVAVILTVAVLSAMVWFAVGAVRTAGEYATRPLSSEPAPNVYGKEADRTSTRLLDGSPPVKSARVARAESERGTYQRWYADQIATTTDIGEIIAARDGRTIRAALVLEPGATWRGWARGRHDRLIGFKALDARMPNLKTALSDAYIDTATWHDYETRLVGSALADKDGERYNVVADVALADKDGDEYPNLIIRKIYAP